MKEKTYKDLGLDEGDKYLERISKEIDLGDFELILDDNNEDKDLTNEKMKEIKDKI